MKLFSLKSVCVAASLLAAGNALAHGIWLEQRRGNLEVVYGHGPSDDAYPNSKFHGAWGYDKAGNPVAIQVQKLDTHVRLLPQGQQPAVIVAALNNGHYARGADEKLVNQRKSQVPGATMGAGNWKYSITVLQPDAKIPTQTAGVRLLVVPEKDPLKLKMGEALPVKVLLDGKPVAGVKLTQDYRNASEAPPVETDSNGRANLTVRNGGLNVISAGYTHKVSDDPDEDEIWMNSTLTFLASKQ